MLLALWLYGTSEGVGSARHLARLCERDHAYQWICGGLKPSYHTLSDFRVEHGDKLDTLLTGMLATLMASKLVTLQRVAQDGTRVRASAGASSFRRASTLRERCLVEAQEQVATLRRELEQDPAASSTRQKAARERAARQRQEAVHERAIAGLPLLQAAHEGARSESGHARRVAKARRPTRTRRRASASASASQSPSTTDPEARVMKMADRLRPAYNLRLRPTRTRV